MSVIEDAELNVEEVTMAMEVMGLWAEIMREWGEQDWVTDKYRFGKLVWDHAPSLGQAHRTLRNSRYIPELTNVNPGASVVS
jgi:hypothetical protein